MIYRTNKRLLTLRKRQSRRDTPPSTRKTDSPFLERTSARNGKEYCRRLLKRAENKMISLVKLLAPLRCLAAGQNRVEKYGLQLHENPTFDKKPERVRCVPKHRAK